MKEPVSISVFTPSRTDPAVLEAITVQRQKLLNDAVARVRESILTKHKHHLLFVGPRGSGKTHLTTLIENRVKLDTELESRMHIAWLNEDETCTTPLEFLSRIFRALGKRYPDTYDAEKLEPAYELKPDAAFNFLQILLKDTLDGRTLLVLVENLDATFEALGTKGQHALRAMIQENPVFCIVATAQRLVSGLSKRESPFFGFFQNELLKFLTVQEATELLLKIAQHNEQDDTVEFLNSPRGEARVRALHHLSGGNHRVFIVLSQFITRKSIDSLVGPFLKMIDELTPYYQERLRWLPPLQRKIVELLCRSTHTVAVKDIAKPLFSTNSTIAKQLGELREKGYVESSKRGRESLYEIAEPLMRICTEIKENQSPGPLALLVDFLRVWYDDGDMETKLMQCDPASLSCKYLTSAIARNQEDGNLRKQLLICSLESELLSLGKHDSIANAKRYTSIHDQLGLAYMEWTKKNSEKSLDYINQLLDGSPAPNVETNALNLKGLILFNNECIGEAGEVFQRISSTKDLLPNDRAVGLLCRAAVNSSVSGNHTLAIQNCSEIIEINNVSELLLSGAYMARGMIHCMRGALPEAIADFSSAIDSDGTADNMARAILWRGTAYKLQKKSELELLDYSQVIHLPKIQNKYRVAAYLGQGCVSFEKGNWKEGINFIHQGLKKAKGIISENKEIPRYCRRIVASLFNTIASNSSASHIMKLASLFNTYGQSSTLGEALIEYLGFCQKDARLKTETLNQWLTAWKPALAEHEEYQVTLRLLETGIRFLIADGDESTLLDLVKPEREILRQAFGLSSN